MVLSGSWNTPVLCVVVYNCFNQPWINKFVLILRSPTVLVWPVNYLMTKLVRSCLIHNMPVSYQILSHPAIFWFTLHFTEYWMIVNFSPNVSLVVITQSWNGASDPIHKFLRLKRGNCVILRQESCLLRGLRVTEKVSSLWLSSGYSQSLYLEFIYSIVGTPCSSKEMKMTSYRIFFWSISPFKNTESIEKKWTTY